MSDIDLTDRRLRYLAHGEDLAREIYGDSTGAHHVIWTLLVDAVDLVDRLPDQERAWLTSGTRAQGLRPMGLSTQEMIAVIATRIMSGIPVAEHEPSYGPQAEDHDRMMEVLSWMRFVRPKKNWKRLHDAAVELARGSDHDVVARIYAPHRKSSRQTIYEVKLRTTGFITSALAREGIEYVGHGKFSHGRKS